ncbi:hypothetical protein FHS34_000341 [Streptomyces echinatus]|uniref:Uncharacterized protein n=1 Tax=Streptomyces echinatus TaxID=67293 RepID=A0A7W9PNG1_9ACTN|nr:hypothetical protein [Streptomyces echinatus]
MIDAGRHAVIDAERHAVIDADEKCARLSAR